jgi:hypothetical protein
MVYHAAGRGIRIDECECELSGKIDLRGFLGISDDVRRGYERIDVTFRVVSEAPEEQLEECALFSPVYDVVTRGTRVALSIEKKEERAEQPAPAGPNTEARPS